MSENNIDSVVEELLVKAVEENPTLNINSLFKHSILERRVLVLLHFLRKKVFLFVKVKKELKFLFQCE